MPRPLSEQVVVITGASNGIGRETALQFGRAGASVVVSARNGEALGTLTREVERLGGQAEAVVADVAVWDEVEAVAQRAIDRFGRIDTWVNNAAVSVYGTVDQLRVDEIERVVRVNLLGQIHGVKAALPRMKLMGQGTIINVGSALSARGVPLQAAYVATKHGIKGFSEALRLELQTEGSPIEVVLVMPSSVNTPLFSQARSKIGVRPMPIPPVYEPRVVAESILFAAEHGGRDIVVGGSGKLLVEGERLSPTLLDRYMTFRGQMVEQQRTDRPDDGRDNLFEPLPGPGAVTGEFGEGSMSVSLYTRHLEHHPNRKRALVAAALLATAALIRRLGR